MNVINNQIDVFQITYQINGKNNFFRKNTIKTTQNSKFNMTTGLASYYNTQATVY